MDEETKKYLSIFSRYILLILIAIPGLKIFYYLFLPLTLYPVYWLLSFNYVPSIVGSTIFVGTKTLDIIAACVAGSAYYFLLILNFTTGRIKLGKRLLLVLYSFGVLLLINIIRIYSLSIMYLHNSPYFNFVHKLFWYLGSTIIVVLIWFLGVYLFKIKDTPIYSDLKFMYSKTHKKKRKSKR